jgi:hypothetical protein
MSTPAFRRFANPLSIWIAMLAIVLQSVMPMVAQARMRTPAMAALATAATPADRDIGGMGHAMPAQAGAAAVHGGEHASMSHEVMPAQASTAHADANASADLHPGASSSQPANPHSMHGDAPCPYCRVHLDVVSLPPVPNPHWVLLVTVVHRAIADEAVPVLPEAWSPTRPRGPPLIA